jgi:Tfp pilus assembly protein FimV
MAVGVTQMTGGELDVYGAARPSAVTLRRRRVRATAVLVLLTIALAWGAVRAAAALGGDPASVHERRPGPVAAEAVDGPLASVAPPAAAPTYLVEPGDTLWSIARGLQPEGDIRPLVRSLVDANGGAELSVGQRLVVPADMP